ncbi:TatD DNase family protein [Microdochium nivale]|nr:TatD DNase family protein [Microdochium nivale]
MHAPQGGTDTNDEIAEIDPSNARSFARSTLTLNGTTPQTGNTCIHRRPGTASSMSLLSRHLQPRLLRCLVSCPVPHPPLHLRIRPLSSMASENRDQAPAPVYTPRYIDIGINLADPIFRGRYHGKQRHPDDLGAVISRAKEVGCQKLIVTGSDLASSKKALEIAREYRKTFLLQNRDHGKFNFLPMPHGTSTAAGVVYTTAGIHPCSSSVFSTSSKPTASDNDGSNEGDGHSTPCEPDPIQSVSEDQKACPKKTAQIISSLRSLIIEAQSSSTPDVLVAFGEFGLDYDRLHYCSRKVQLHSFSAQLDLVLAMKPQLPLFLHSRAAHADFVALLKEKFGPGLEKLERGGVVHSFTGTAAEMHELMDLGLYIGTNGCSFKTAENCEVVKEIKLDRLMLETDGPWCEVRPSHEGWKYLVGRISADREAAAAATAAAPAARNAEAQDGGHAPVLTAATAALAETSLVPPSQAPSPGSTTTTNSNGTNTPSSSSHAAAGPKPRRKPAPPKQTKKEPDVPERWKAVKKEKWVEGAMVKSRNEPCMIERVATVVAAVKEVSVEEVCEAAWENTRRVFKLD